MTKTVLLVGATGTLGSRIAHHLVDQPDVRLRLLLRDGLDPARRDALKPVLQRGAVEVVGGLTDTATLNRATRGVDVVVSAVAGGPEIIVDGQVALAQAAQRSGVSRILPSTFSLDFTRPQPGDYPLLDMRREVCERISEVGIEQVHLLQGSFMDLFVPGAFVVGRDGVVDYWGDGTEPLQVTSIEDTARVATRVALDPTLPAGLCAVAGDDVSILSAAAEVERRTGRTLRRRRLGSEPDLQAALDRARRGSNPVTAAVLSFHLLTLTGEAALRDLRNHRYPDLQLETFRQFVTRAICR